MLQTNAKTQAAIAIAACCVAGTAAGQSPLPERWMDTIEQLGWTYTGYRSGEWVQFAHPGRAPDEIWVRWEVNSSHRGFLSARELYKVDCENWTYLILEESLFAERNLREWLATQQPDPQWRRAAPSSMVNLVVQYACDEMRR